MDANLQYGYGSVNK